MAKDSDKLRRSFDVGETGGALSGLLADDEELDRGALWRLGSWAAVSVAAVIVALIANQSSIGVRREQSASADLLKQAQQLQSTAKESQNETRRLASAVDTLNSDRDRLYSRVAVIEQGLDSVTGTIARQSPSSSAPPTGASQSSLQTPPGQGGAGQASAASQGNTNQGNASVTAATGPSAPSPSASPPAAGPTASIAPVAPATTASVDPQASVTKSSPAPVVAAVAATAPAAVDKAAAIDKVSEKQDKQALAVIPSEPSPSGKSATDQKSTVAQPLSSLVASRSMMGPPDPAAGKLIEPSKPPKTAAAAPMPEVAAVGPTKAVDEAEATPSAAIPELVAPRTEFGVDVGGANSIPGLRALWRGLLKSKSNAALTKLRPIIVIKENNTGLGMQLRLIAGPISDAAAAAKICASLTVSDRGCTTSVFEGQRLAFGPDDVDKSEASKAEDDDRPVAPASRSSSRRHSYGSKHAKDEDPPPKPQPSTLSLIFGKRQ